MNRIAAATLLATGLFAVPLKPTAVAAVPQDCLDNPTANLSSPVEPIADKPGSLQVYLNGADCTDGGSATLVLPDGSMREVAWQHYEGRANPTLTWAITPVPVANGAGTWKLTALSYQGQTKALPAPRTLQVLRATKLVPDTTHLVVPKGRTPVLTGVAQRYTSTGGLTPVGAGHTVFTSAPTTGIKTDANGRYRISYPMDFSASVGLRLQPSTASLPPANATVYVELQGGRERNPCLQEATFEAFPKALTTAPAEVGIRIVNAICGSAAVTVQRADGTNKQKVPLPTIQEHPDFRGTYGSFLAPVANGAGSWLITHVHQGGTTYKLPKAFTFVVKRGVRVTVPRTVKTLPGRSTTIAGTAAYYTSTGKLLPLPNRTVQVSGYPIGTTQNESVLTRVKTDSAGRFRFTLKVTREHYLYVRVWSNSSVIANGYAPSDLRFNPRPSTVDGVADPTSATVVTPGTKMSTYGHLRVMYTNGSTGPFPGQQVLVQTRPKGGTAYSTVATASTTSTGYYYANWNASVDADVRVAFVSPYSTIASSYRWIRFLDVR